MAPRRKRTTSKATKAKPNLPEGFLDSSMTVEDKEGKLFEYVNAYELQARRNLDYLKKCLCQVNSLFTGICRNVLIGIPKDIKEMTMEEFLRKGGTIDTALGAEIAKDMTFLTCSPLQTIDISKSEANIANQTGGQVKKAPAESNVKTVGKSTRKRKARIADETPAPAKKLATATTTTRSSRRLQAKNSMITPVPNTNSHSVFQTPFITPKFDPRLPITPAVLREPKAGERIVSMSGSPLTNPVGPVGSTPQIFIPLKGGKTMQVSLNDKTSKINELYVNDNIALKNIKLIQEKLSLLLKMPENMQIP